MKTLDNELYSIEFNDTKKKFIIIDFTDIYNGTTSYNQNKRQYSKFKETIIKIFEDEQSQAFKDMGGIPTTFWGIVRLASETFNLKMHTFCSVN
jgi:hypothetical protein